MKLHGSISDNLDHAVTSARRLRGHPVYSETLTYWRDLLQEARRILQNLEVTDSKEIEASVIRLENELAERGP